MSVTETTNAEENDKSNEEKQDDINYNIDEKTKKMFKDNVIVQRKSLILELYEVEHIKNIHYIFMVLLLSLFINQIADGIIHKGRWSIHINIIYSNFSDGYIAIIGWLIVFASILLVYPAFQLWSFAHIQMIKTTAFAKSWNALWITIVLAFYYEVFAWTGYYITECDLSFTSSFTLAMEATRLLMKTHSFIRENVNKTNFKMPTFLHFFEFLFMPTLIYRDSYPGTKSIKWHKVCIYAFELCGVTIFLCYMYNIYFSDECIYFKTSTSPPNMKYLWLILRNTVPSFGIMLLYFYFIFHLWQNLFGELTRFADRQFYQDWWNSTSYDEYFRKWNILVHDWLYNYIYKDLFEIFGLQSTWLLKFSVFLISSVVHEYIIYYSLRMFYPILGTTFLTFAMLFTSLPFRSPKFWLMNVLFLYGHAFGLSFVMTSYSTEYCVRQNACSINSTKIPFDWLYSQTLFSDCVLQKTIDDIIS